MKKIKLLNKKLNNQKGYIENNKSKANDFQITESNLNLVKEVSLLYLYNLNLLLKL